MLLDVYEMFGLVALLSNGSLFSSEMRTDFFGRICQSCKRFPDDAGDNNDYDFDDDTVIPDICHFFSTYPIFYKNFLHAKARKSRQNGSHKNSVKQTL